ncbi:MAG TPA: ribosome silencing factor [Prolixibacteraceae bacterium]|nr:ribosome silencing factor [Bacteroidales bacterium]HNZ71850.1 ribosome silencing factor [Prolixibacteraceae bacterium]HUM88334.1 ribosome silencing factor [Prolixibacteraceae bacterium]
MDQTNNNTSNTLIDAIVEGVRRKKGESIVDLDMIMLENSQCDHFIICHGNSNTQVEAIARSVEETVEEYTGQNAWHADGYRNAQWILLDYSDVMVHVFQKEFRNHYDLESLWADAQINIYKSEN